MEFIPRIIMRNPLTTDLMFMLLVTVTVLFVPSERKVIVMPDVCTSEACVKEASFFKININRSKNPCEEFHDFVCGGCKIYDPTRLLHQQIRNRMIEIYQPPYMYYEHPMLNIQKRLYALCEQEVRLRLDKFIFRRNSEMIKETMHLLGEWPILQGPNWRERRFDWVEATYVLKELGYNHEIFFNISVVPDPRNTKKHIFKVSTVPVRLPTSQDMKKYEKFFGANMKTMTHAVDEVHASIATLLLELGSLYPSGTDPKALDELFTISSIQHQQATQFNWLEFINQIIHPIAKLSQSDFILISNPKRVVSLIDNLSKIPKRPLANLIIWTALEETISSFESPSCFEKMQEIFLDFPQPLDVIYLKKHFSYEIYKNVREMINHIAHVTLEMIKQSTWLNNKDKRIIRKSLKQLTTDMIIGAPNEYFNNNILNEWMLDLQESRNQTFFSILSTDSYLKMFLFVQKLKRHYLYKKIFKSISQTKFSHWNLYGVTSEVLDYYPEDRIVLPATLLQNDFYNSKRPNYLNYGSLGTFIAADLIYNFTILLLYDDGWSNETIRTVLQFRNCLLQQMKDHFNVNGIEEQWDHKLLLQTLSANISYSAYKKWEKENGSERRLWNSKYTNDQLFWIAAGSNYCNFPIWTDLASFSLSRLTALRNFYVGAIGINHDNFAKDFKCDPKSMMNPLKKCKIF